MSVTQHEATLTLTKVSLLQCDELRDTTAHHDKALIGGLFDEEYGIGYRDKGAGRDKQIRIQTKASQIKIKH